MAKHASWRLPVAGAILALSLATAGYYAGRLLQPVDTTRAAVELGVSGHCMPVGRECDAGSGSFTIRLHLAKHVSPLQPFDVEVTARGIPGTVRSVDVNFVMTGMDMGMNRYYLMRATGTSAVNKWTGRSTLPVCSASRLDWVATVTVETADTAYRARFPFRAAPAL